MKKIMNLVVILTSTLILQCCSSDDPFSDSSSTTAYNTENPSNAPTSSTVSTGNSKLTTFDVIIDKTTAEPTDVAEAFYPDTEDDMSNNSFETEIKIVFDGTTVTTDATSGVSITADGAHVVADHGDTKGICYVVSGTTANGSLTIVGNKKYEVRLNGTDITNPDSTALNLLSKKRAYVVMADGTTNRLSDGTSSKADDQKAAFYCKGKLLFGSGKGTLEVYGNYNNAIHSADYIVFDQGCNIYAKSTANHGIKANDGIYINGGILNVEVSAEAAKGINCESNITVNGGRTTVVTTGTGAYEDNEAKGAAALKCDSTLTVNGGELWLKSTGAGGKGIRAGWEAYFNGGKVRVVTTGRQYTYGRDTASPKGIKVGEKNVHGVLNIYGGDVLVRTTGTSGEGIESKGTISIDGSMTTVGVSAYDDAINSAGDMHLMGGTVTAIGSGNDGIDANGNMYISGGNIVAFGAGDAESGIDTGEQYRLYITGGSVFAIGGRIDATYTTTTDAQPYTSTTGSVSQDATVTLTDGSTTLATFAMPASYNNGTILVSAPGMTSGNSYTLSLGSSQQTVTATTTASNGGMGGIGGMGDMGGMGGGRPGGH